MEILQATLKGYERVLEAARLGTSQRNRARATTHLARRAKRLAGKHTWFQDRSKEEEDHGRGDSRQEHRKSTTRRKENTRNV